MPLQKPIEYNDANPVVRAVFDEIMELRQVKDVNNFWKYLANNPEELRRTWDGLRDVMGEGALDPLIKEMIYMAVSIANGCSYCIHSHTAAAQAKGMSKEMYGELLAVVGMASKTNALATAHQVPIDEGFK